MEGTCKESLINQKKKYLTFYSITEKQDESSNSSISDSKYGKQLIIDDNSKKHFIKFSEPKKKLNIKSEIKPKNKSTFARKRSSKSFNLKSKEKEKEKEDKNLKKFLKKESNKRVKDLKKRISEQLAHDDFYIIQLKTRNNSFHMNKKRNSSSKGVNLPFNMMNKFNYKNDNPNISPPPFPAYDNILNSNNNNKLFSMINSNIISSRAMIRNKSINVTSTESINHFYSFNSNKEMKAKKNMIRLNSKKMKINYGDDRTLQLSFFEKLKNSPMFEKSERIIYREKILYGLLGFFTILSLLFQILDAIFYNKKSMQYLERNHFDSDFDLNDINKYYLMEERKISELENNMRVCNLIFSIICVILNLYIYFIKNQFVKLGNENNNNFYNYYNYYNKRKKKKYKTIKKDDERIIIIPNNDDLDSKKEISITEIIKVCLICIINAIFYPPSINKVFIKINKDIIHVYSLNSIILFFSFLKSINIYRAMIHLTPLNNLLYKTMCKSKMVEIDYLFTIRCFLSRYPLTFIILNFILIGTIFCISIFCLEYFSLDIKKGLWNNKGNNNLKNFYNAIYLYLFFIIKNIYGDIQPISILGAIIMILIGSIALFIISYFFYYIIELIKFSPEEEKAYFKLIKILNPINKEHKSANLIKIFIIMKKVSIDYKSAENDYTNKRLNKFKEFRKMSRKNNLFNFGNDSDIYRNFTMINEYNDYIEKSLFINFLIRKFLSKVKLISECNNFRNNLIIARSFSHSFTDLLKNLVEKMNENLYQLNSKLQFLIKKEEKYKDFMKIHKSSLKKIKKVMGYQYFILNYLINKHNNENYDDFLKIKRHIRKTKTNKILTGSVIYHNQKLIKGKNKKCKFECIQSPSRTKFIKMKSSVFGPALSLNKGNIKKSKTNDNKHGNINNIINGLKIKRTKSLNIKQILNNINIIKKFYINGFTKNNKTIKRQKSYNYKSNKIFDDLKINIAND